MRVYIGERHGDVTTVVIVENSDRPSIGEVGDVLDDIRDLSRELGGLGRPDDRWDAVMGRKRDLLDRIEAAERNQPTPLPNVLGQPFAWGTPNSGSLAAAILTVELGEQPPPAVYARFATDVINTRAGHRFRLTSGEVWEWARVNDRLLGGELSFNRHPRPAMAVVRETDAEPVPSAEPDGPTASALVQACEEAWTAIRAHHPKVPDAVMILGTGVERGRLVKLGHWWGGRWLADGQVRGEVLLAGEALHLPPENVFEVLLHEAAHGLNAARGIKDTSRGGRYHNARFAETAAEVGLTAEAMPPYGMAHTNLSDIGRDRYASSIGRLGEAMRIARQLERSTQIGVGAGTETSEGREGTTETRKRQAQVAECGCGRRLRMAPSVLAAGPVICGMCEAEFTPTMSARAERSAEAVVDHSFMARRQVALGRTAADGESARSLAAERSKLGAALSLVGPEHGDATAPLRERTDRLTVLLDRLCKTVAPEPTEATAVQREGVRELARISPADSEPLADWYRRFATSEEQPMVARSESERDRQVTLARSLLKADGTLTGPSVRVDEREFMAGDRLVATSSKADALPMGVLGTVEKVDPVRGELKVNFATLGRLRLSLPEVVAEGLRHDYAEVAEPVHDGCEPQALQLELERIVPGIES